MEFLTWFTRSSHVKIRRGPTRCMNMTQQRGNDTWPKWRKRWSDAPPPVVATDSKLVGKETSGLMLNNRMTRGSQDEYESELYLFRS
jgi:hypothetical protein